MKILYRCRFVFGSFSFIGSCIGAFKAASQAMVFWMVFSLVIGVASVLFWYIFYPDWYEAKQKTKKTGKTYLGMAMAVNKHHIETLKKASNCDAIALRTGYPDKRLTEYGNALIYILNHLQELPKEKHSIQMTYAFHKYIHGFRTTGDGWNDLDEQAYQVALKGE